MTEDKFLETVLDEIEERESRLLVWGITDAAISREELSEIINDLLDDALTQGVTGFVSTSEVIEALTNRALLFPASGGNYEGYRTRMSETVRLLFNLRQLFPKHAGRDGWQHGRTLVSDFRFSRRRRKYPKRDLGAKDVAAKITKSVSSKSFIRALNTMICSRDEGFSLAEFQVSATERIVAGLEQGQTSGTLVSAGTGSGKTLAFYIPALARIATHILNDPPQKTNWVKCLALYPRTELLKDQFSEIYNEARRLDHLTSENSRKIRIGAFFGATPYSAEKLLEKKIDGWERKGDGFRCGFMACPTSGCSGDLIWPEADVRTGNELLQCDECHARITDDEVTLTRQSLQKDPPDILFTTTEMLNQRMSDSYSRHLFGLGPKASRAPEMVLLDEVHTYSGFHGAQVAYLLRRWKHLVRAPITFVGLSATLRDGSRFFARLTGLYESKVQEVAPKRTDMISEGAEYILALKGDPVSKTSLLSTTIQTAMLLSRMLDGPVLTPSNGLYGKKVFAFTDDIDVINRLYFGMLDAEGRSSFGTPDMARHPNGGLAHLRLPIPSESRERYGQNWSAPIQIGHDLSESKSIGRTSSQDPGVFADNDIVVATASLEVGFNDPTVGVVLQHKAPRSVASFLQRKGRAGRSRKMRPWTVLVLSDYGRDRDAYQAYDRLFDPELEIQAIPLTSRYIQHIQAVYSLIDYLGQTLPRGTSNGSVWTDLSLPKAANIKTTPRQEVLRHSLTKILSNERESDAFRKFLTKSLGHDFSDENFSEADALAALWEHPRPVFTTVIPTAIRRLSTNWRRNDQDNADFQIPNSPLPEFAPATLFSDLNLPEVRINLPRDTEGSKDRDPEAMPITQAMKTFAPGRVSRRFGVHHVLVRHWIAPENLSEEPTQDLCLEDHFSGNLLGEWQIFDGETTSNLPVLRPYEINPTHPPRTVRDTSNAQLIWRSQIVKRVAGSSLLPPKKSLWDKIILKLEAYTHRQQNPIEVRRFAVGSMADIPRERQDDLRKRFNFKMHDRPASVGFSISVDAIRLCIEIPNDIGSSKGNFEDKKWQGLRTSRYHHLIVESDNLSFVTNPFLRQWLGSIYFSALTYEAVSQKISIAEAAIAFATGKASISLSHVINAVFQSVEDSDDEEASENETTLTRDRLRSELEALLQEETVLDGLYSTAVVLWQDIDETWQDWLVHKYKSTIASAANRAIGSLCPDMEPEGLIVDIDPGPRAPEDVEGVEGTTQEVWISETSPGGTGHIEEFISRYGDDPRRFYSLLAASLNQTEHQLVDYQLCSLLKGLAGTEKNLELVEAVSELRNSHSAQQTEERFATLRQSLKRNNFLLFHRFSTAISNRITRVGSSSETDSFLHRLLSFWDAEEARLGVEIDARTIAYFFSQDDDMDSILLNARFTLPDHDRKVWRFNVIYGMLWPRGAINRRQGLELYNPFSELHDSEPLLVAEHLTNKAERIYITNSDWKERAIDALSRSGIVTLVSDIERKSELAKAASFFATNPVPSEYLSVFARLGAFRRLDSQLEIDFELAEVAQ